MVGSALQYISNIDYICLTDYHTVEAFENWCYQNTSLSNQNSMILPSYVCMASFWGWPFSQGSTIVCSQPVNVLNKLHTPVSIIF